MDAATSPRRPRGRPQVRCDEETLHVIAEAARGCFVENGYSTTSMDQVAQAAGVSKKTLYRLVPTKAELFKAAISDRISSFMLALDEDALARMPFVEALEHLMRKYGEMVLSSEVVAVQKLVMAEGDRFPELTKAFQTGAIQATQVVIARLLRRGCAEGVVDLPAPDVSAGMLRGMMVMEPQRAAMIGGAPLPSAAEIAERARICVGLFLYGGLKRCSESAQAVGERRSRT